MAQDYIIRRTEKLRALKALLEEKHILYISAFFYSGKTVLLDQLEKRLDAPALRFDCGQDDWDAFAEQAAARPDAVLLIDGVERLDGEEARAALGKLLLELPERQRAVLTGRAQQPAFLRRLLASGAAALLDREFVFLSVPEIEQLLLNYGVTLSPANLAYLKRVSLGWPVAIHSYAQRQAAAPERTVRSLFPEVLADIRRMVVNDVLHAFPQPDQTLLLNLSPFAEFTEEMAQMVTGRTDAPDALAAIADNSHMLLAPSPGRYSFIPFGRETFFHELKTHYTQEYIDGLYGRAALYHELQNHIPQAIRYYIQLGNHEKVRELLIRDTHLRPGNGDYVELRDAYALLSEDEIKASPELMKGMCMIESLLCRPEESERWYAALRQLKERTSPREAVHRTAAETLAWLDIILPHRGSAGMLNTLISTAKLTALTQSPTWRQGFNVAGNGVSLMNGGIDFCRWAPHGWALYRLFKAPVELALGRDGSGLADIAIAERELECNLRGDYAVALDKVFAGISRLSDDLELRCAAIGIQSRILAAQGLAGEGRQMVKRLIDALPDGAPPRMRQNLETHRLTLSMLLGETEEALSWLETGAPDETGVFCIMDRYRYLLKLRLYVVTAQWSKLPLLTAKLRHYFDTYDRPYLRIQLHLIQAIACERTGDERWRQELASALALAKRYRLARVIAGEGIAIVDMLNEMALPDGAWERGVLELTRAQAARYPAWMRQIAVRPVFTPREAQVYSLMIAGYKNAKIASILCITERTVKFHAAEIYAKLGVSTRAEAINRAAELGDIR